MLTEEEKYLFFEKTPNDLIAFSKAESLKKEDCTNFIKALKKVNEDIEYILENRYSDIKLEKKKKMFPYLNIISQQEYDLLDTLFKEAYEIKDNNPYTDDTNQEFRNITSNLRELRDKIKSLEISKEEYLSQIKEIKQQIEIYSSNLKIIKEQVDEANISIVLSKYK